MSRSPAVSIVVPLYNKAQYIEAVIDSVLGQTFQDFELIIVDDGSTDGGPDFVRNIRDSRVRLITQDNAGVSAARNHGASVALGEYLAFLDADDYWDKRYLEIMLTAFMDKDDVWAMCGEKRIKSISEISDMDFAYASKFEKMNFFRLFLHGQVGCPGTILLKRGIFDASQGFAVGVKNGEDVEMWFRLALRYPDIQFIPDNLVFYTVAAPGGATVNRRSEISLISFWERMAALHEESKGGDNHQLFVRCFNIFANKSYRFYVRSGYFDAAQYLNSLKGYTPSRLNVMTSWMPMPVSSVFLKLIHHARYALRLMN